MIQKSDGEGKSEKQRTLEEQKVWHWGDLSDYHEVNCMWGEHTPHIYHSIIPNIPFKPRSMFSVFNRIINFNSHFLTSSFENILQVWWGCWSGWQGVIALWWMLIWKYQFSALFFCVSKLWCDAHDFTDMVCLHLLTYVSVWDLCVCFNGCLVLAGCSCCSGKICPGGCCFA